MALVLSPTIAELLRELAGDRDIEEFIIDIVTERLDPPRKVEVYLRLSEDYLKAADELYNKGDLVQAGEKYWGAIAALLNAIAELRGWDHYSHRDYDVIIGRLYKETKDKSILTNSEWLKDYMQTFTTTSWIGRNSRCIGRLCLS